MTTDPTSTTTSAPSRRTMLAAAAIGGGATMLGPVSSAVAEGGSSPRRRRMRSLWIGCYTPDTGQGEGVYALPLDRRTGAGGELRLASGAPESPSWLVGHDRGVLAISETEPGAVALVRDGRQADGEPPSSGTGSDGPAHAALVGDDLLLVAHYATGVVTSVRLRRGVPTQVVGTVDLDGLVPLGPRPDRQDASHPHQISPGPAGGAVLVPDLGADVVHRIPVDGRGRLGEPATAIAAPAGFGPRHLVHVGDLALVVGELANEVWVGRREGDRWVETDRASTLVGPREPGWSSDPEANDGAGTQASAIRHVRVSGEDLVLVGNRGADSVTVLRLDRRRGRLTSLREIGTHGTWPRDLVVVGDDIWVANERSHEVTRVAWRGQDAGALRQRVAVGSPTAVLLR